MTLTARKSSSPLLGPAILFTLILVVFATTSWIPRSDFFAEDPGILSFGVALDLTLSIPILYYLLARQMSWPRISVIPVFVLCLLIGRVILPPDHHRPLEILEFVAIPLELLMIALIIRKAHGFTRAYRGIRPGPGEFVDAMETLLRQALANRRLAGIALTEVSVMYFGFMTWHKKPAADPSGRSFSYHRNSGYGALVGAFAFLILVETGLLHMVLVSRVPILAWVLTALSLYGLLFLLADYHATRLCPIVIDESDRLHLRIGFRVRTTLDLCNVDRAEVSSTDLDDKRNVLEARLMNDHNVILYLRQPRAATGLYGRSMRFDRALLSVDDPAALVDRIQSARRSALD